MSYHLNLQCEIDSFKLIEGLAKAIDVKFLGSQSSPDTPEKAIVVAEKLLKSIAETINEISSDERACIVLAKKLNFGRFMDKAELLSKIMSDISGLENVPDKVKDLLRALLNESKD